VIAMCFGVLATSTYGESSARGQLGVAVRHGAHMTGMTGARRHGLKLTFLIAAPGNSSTVSPNDVVFNIPRLSVFAIDRRNIHRARGHHDHDVCKGANNNIVTGFRGRRSQ